MSNFDTSRRGFVAASTLAAGAAAVPSFAINKNLQSDKEYKIALIGCGGRGTGAAFHATNVKKNVKIVAVADAFADKAEATAKKLKQNKASQTDLPKERIFSGFNAYKDAIDKSGCNMVILATPPGFRPIHFEYAVKAGKHVFMEKPVAVDAPGVRKVLEAGKLAKKKNLAVAVGLQRRHEPQYIETIKRLQDGAIGDIKFCRAFWNSGGVWVRPRQEGQTEMQYQMRNWYYFNWLCGDNITEQHIHNLDVINWLKGGFPVKANGMGGRQQRVGGFKDKNGRYIDYGEIFDHHFIEYTYEDGTIMYSQSRHQRGCMNSVSEHAHGTKGVSNISRQTILGENRWRYKGKRKGGHQNEWFDLIASIDKGEIPNEAEYGAKSSMTAILGRMASYSGKEITWDSALASNKSLAPTEYDWKAMPQPKPDDKGNYPIPIPGITKVL